MHRKSLDRIPPPELAIDRDFWRGVVDGDGCLQLNRKGPTLYLVGGEAICGMFAEYCRTFLKRDALTVSKVKNKNLHSVRMDSGGAAKIVRELYDGASLFLDRKMATATAMMAYKFTRHWRYYSLEDDSYIRSHAGHTPWVEMAAYLQTRVGNVLQRAEKLMGYPVRHRKAQTVTPTLPFGRTVDRQRKIFPVASTQPCATPPETGPTSTPSLPLDGSFSFSPGSSL